MINTIIFDLGGVLIDWNPRYFYKRLFKTEAAMEYFLTKITCPDWNEEQDGGRPIEEATNELMAVFPQYRNEINAYYEQWELMLNGSLSQSVEVLRELKDTGKYKIYALTNWSAETWPRATAIFDFLHWFDGVLVSGQEKMRKPNHDFYQLMMDRFNIDKNTSIFIDDNYRNVVAAREFGLSTIHFLDPLQMKNELHQNGIAFRL